MLFQTHTEDLKPALSLASSALASRPTHPILGCFKLTVAGETLTITSFDLSVAVETTVEVEVTQIGECCVSASLLSQVISKFQACNMVFSLEDDMLVITTDSGSYSLRTLGVEDYPAIPSVMGSASVLSSFVLEAALKATLFSVSSDETKQILTGLNVKGTGTEMKFAGTDGHRLAVYTKQNSVEDFNFTLPLKTSSILGKLCDISDEISVKLDANYIQFRTPVTTLTSRHIEGDYPAYEQLIPQQFASNCTVDRRELIGTLNRINTISDRGSGVVKILLISETSEMLVSANSRDVGFATESLPIQLVGEPLTLGFNIRYLVDSLKHMETNEVQISMNSPTSSVIIRPLGGTDIVTHLIMPVQLKNTEGFKD